MTSRIRIPTFDAEVVFIFDADKGTVERFLNRLAKLKTERLQDEYVGITLDIGNMTWVIYIPDTTPMDDIQLVRTLSHETTHVVLQLLDRVGVQDDETFCYSQDSLLGMLLEKVAR